MKTTLFMLTLATAGISLMGCEDDDHIRVDDAVESAFQNQYPNATRVEWEKKAGYYVADFRLDKTEAEAWYNMQAMWRMTETDVRYDALPQAIRDALGESEYADWRIDDIDMLECPDMETVYIIEVEKGKVEYDLYYSPEGVFIKAVPDEENPGEHIPPTVLPGIKEYISEKYPEARIVDIDSERNAIEVDIVDGRTPRELKFTQKGEWIHTKTEVRKAEVPETVMNALSASEYGSWKIDDIDFYQTPAGNYYLFELESGNQEFNLKIDTDGNIL